MPTNGKDWILENESSVIEVADLVYAKQTFGKVRWVLAVRKNPRSRASKICRGKLSLRNWWGSQNATSNGTG